MAGPSKINMAAIPHGVCALHQFADEVWILAGRLDDRSPALQRFREFLEECGNFDNQRPDDVIFAFHDSTRQLVRPTKNPIAQALWGSCLESARSALIGLAEPCRLTLMR